MNEMSVLNESIESDDTTYEPVDTNEPFSSHLLDNHNSNRKPIDNEQEQVNNKPTHQDSNAQNSNRKNANNANSYSKQPLNSNILSEKLNENQKQANNTSTNKKKTTNKKSVVHRRFNF
jgi:hypothetical protein